MKQEADWMKVIIREETFTSKEGAKEENFHKQKNPELFRQIFFSHPLSG